MTNKNKRGIPPLGVENWRSYSCFRAGVRWSLRKENEEARRMFLQALNYDENNRGALFNLGVLDVEAKRYDQALRWLRKARGIAIRVEQDFAKDAVWYKTTYQIAATCSYDTGNRPDSLEEATKEVEALTKTIRQTLAETRAEIGKRAGSKKRSDQRLMESLELLKEFLEDLKPLAEILHAGILIEQDPIEQDTFEKAQEKVAEVKKGELSYRAHYNLACYYSRRVGRELPELCEPLYKKALGYLEYALGRDDSLVQWAGKDPALENLRKNGASKREFDELTEKYAAPTSSKAEGKLPLADLAAIGGTYAALLKEHGISSRDDLIRKADTPEAQQKLAEELGIDVSLVRRWALLADLLRVVNLDAGSGNLLEATGVTSLRDLGGCDPKRLTKLLSQENRARSIVDHPPTKETVRCWVRDAGSTTLPIVAGERETRS